MLGLLALVSFVFSQEERQMLGELSDLRVQVAEIKATLRSLEVSETIS